jgi:hypothetical protein
MASTRHQSKKIKVEGESSRHDDNEYDEEDGAEADKASPSGVSE